MHLRKLIIYVVVSIFSFKIQTCSFFIRESFGHPIKQTSNMKPFAKNLYDLKKLHLRH